MTYVYHLQRVIGFSPWFSPPCFLAATISLRRQQSRRYINRHIKAMVFIKFFEDFLQGEHGVHGDSFLKNLHELHVLPVKNSAQAPTGRQHNSLGQRPR
jgi:hypothetical protein